MDTKNFDPDTFNHWQDIDPEGWKAIVEEIIDSFFSVIEIQNANLQRGLTEQNFELIQSSAHVMKSSLANVGCLAGSKVLKKIEDYATEKNWEQLQLAQKELNDLYAPSIKELKDFRKRP